jgi:hypothetical protein
MGTEHPSHRTSLTPKVQYAFSAPLYDIPERSRMDVTYRAANFSQIGHDMREWR